MQTTVLLRTNTVDKSQDTDNTDTRNRGRIQKNSLREQDKLVKAAIYLFFQIHQECSKK